MDIKRSNPKAFEIITTRLQQLIGVETSAGWFETSHYPDGTPVAEIAAIQEFGAHIDHPGGTPYKIGEDGRAVFVTKANGAGLPVTKPHQIVIPPRPFMRPTVMRETANWIGLMASGAKAILAGNETGFSVMENLGKRAAGDIARSITLVTTPLLKAATIAARRRARSDRVTIGLLTKPLIDSGTMLEQVTSRTGPHDGKE